MNYILDFTIASIFYFSITVFFYFRQRRISNLRNHIYGWLLIFGLASIVLDFLAAVIDPISKGIPLFFLYFINILFLLVFQLEPVLFLFYTMVISGLYPRLTRIRIILLLLPFVLVVILLLDSPFNTYGIFFHDQDHIYRYGATHITLYISALFYLVTSLICVLKARKIIQKKKVSTIIAFVSLTFLSMLLQSLIPGILLNTTAMAVAMNLMYYVLQTPTEHIDAITGILNRSALTEMLDDLYEQNQPFSMGVIQFSSFRSLTSAVGIEAVSTLQKDISSYFVQKFPDRNVFRLSINIFCILSNKPTLSIGRLNEIRNEIPIIWIVNGISISLLNWIVGIQSSDCANPSELLTTIDYIVQEHTRNDSKVRMADKSILERYSKDADVEMKIKQAIEKKEIHVMYQPIVNQNGSLQACEALIQKMDFGTEKITNSEFVRIAEKNNMILDLDAHMIEEACKFLSGTLSTLAPHLPVNVNISIVDCMQHSFIERVRSITSKYAVDPHLLSFEIHETEIGFSVPQVSNSIRGLHELGHSVIIDHFGAGFVVFSYITELPIQMVKIDRSFTKIAAEDEKQRILLKGILSILAKLNITTVCEGVETNEQATVIKQAGCTCFQGYYFAKEMQQDDLVEYIKTQSFLDQLRSHS